MTSVKVVEVAIHVSCQIGGLKGLCCETRGEWCSKFVESVHPSDKEGVFEQLFFKS